MAKVPTLLTAKEWKGAKPTTLVKKTGLGAKLEAWEKAKAALAKAASLQAFSDCAAALKDVVATAKTAQAACNKTLHKDAIAFLAGYTAAVAKVSSGLMKEGEDYKVKVNAWSKKRVDCLALIKKLDPVADQLNDKYEATMKTCEASVKANKEIARSVKLAKSMQKELEDFREEAQKHIDIVRIDDPATRIHADDRDQKYVDMFTEAINLKSSWEGMIGKAATLQKFAKEHG